MRNEQIVTVALKGGNANSDSGNMSTDHYRPGFTRYGAPYVGYLPQRLQTILNERFSAGAISQVIYSYSTPIAWKDGGTWIIPEVTYSTITSTKHQTHLYRLHGQVIPRDAGMEEYLRVLEGHAVYEYAPTARTRSYRGTGL